MNDSNQQQPRASSWCPPGRQAKMMHGQCYCDAPQYSVKPKCLRQEPPCFVKNFDNGFTYYGQNTGAYITHGRRRVES